MHSVMSHNFNMIPDAQIERSVFNRSHGYKTTMPASYLIPFYCDEAIPGDTFQCSTTIFARLSTPLVPLMDNLFLETFFFAVPMRLIWKNWEEFCGAEPHGPGTHVDHLPPQISSTTEDASCAWPIESIHDYMGLPTGITGLKANSFHHRAYNLIYNEWFRDENQQRPLMVFRGDEGEEEPNILVPFPNPETPGDFLIESSSQYGLVPRGKRHDYFTSCLPWPQKGPGVEVGLMGHAPVFGNDYTVGINDTSGIGANLFGLVGDTNNSLHAEIDAFGQFAGHVSTGGYSFPQVQSAGWVTREQIEAQSDFDPTYPQDYYAHSGLYADLEYSTSSGLSINMLRQAFQIQKMHERDARGGTRYVEIIKSHYNVVSPDFRLQRPEYLGGSSTRIIINPVQQTSGSGITDQTTPQGHLAAFGICHENNAGFSKSFVEHCVIIGLVNVRGDITYQQGLPRMFSRQSRYDWYWPALAHLGEQPVYKKEICAVGDSFPADATDDQVFGYQERFAEYRYFPSQITGKMRSAAASEKLDYWHLSEDFAAPQTPPITYSYAPELGEDFITDKTAVTLQRCLAVETEPQLIFDSYMSLKCARPMPVYSVPGLMDHF